MTEFTTIHPTGGVELGPLTRAALKIAGRRVFVTTSLGRQVLRVPADLAGRIYEEVGLAPDGSVIPAPEPARTPKEPGPATPPQAAARPVKPASEPVKESQPTPGSDAPGRPAARPAGRAAKKAASKRTTSARTAQKKEGDDR